MVKSKTTAKTPKAKPTSVIKESLKKKDSTKSKEPIKEKVPKNPVEIYPGPGTLVTNASPRGDWNWKFVSWNINGLRAWMKTNSQSYFDAEKANVVGLQEIKCADDKIPKEVKQFSGYEENQFWSPADKEGYAGTGVLSLSKPLQVKHGMDLGSEHDAEGRVITAEYDQFYFVTAYVPNSGRGLPRLPYRQKEWDPTFVKYLKALDAKKPIIVCGDLNVAHEEIDLANPGSNHKTAGFTNEEREGFSDLLREVDLVDTYRHLYPDKRNAFTFWSYMGNARGKNVGWRLDYFLISKRLLPNLCDHELRTAVKGSDHCPIVLYMKF